VPGAPHAGAWRTKNCILATNYEPKSRSGRTSDQFEEKSSFFEVPISRNTAVIQLGEFVFHCHILEHADGGMMAKIQVVPAPR
jgi:FtsP/CotA-like multicopper oxidase with cupredoxin domain